MGSIKVQILPALWRKDGGTEMMVFSCKACGKPIVFIATVAGKKMPCDAMMRAYEPDADGPDTIITKDGQVVRGRVLANASDGGNFLGHIPHWANCPGAAGLRKMRNPR